jgi:hypothetical protein
MIKSGVRQYADHREVCAEKRTQVIKFSVKVSKSVKLPRQLFGMILRGKLHNSEIRVRGNKLSNLVDCCPCSASGHSE